MSGSIPTPTPLFHYTNIINSPGATAAGLGLILAAVNSAASNGFPTTAQGWVVFVAQITIAISSALLK